MLMVTVSMEGRLLQNQNGNFAERLEFLFLFAHCEETRSAMCFCKIEVHSLEIELFTPEEHVILLLR